MRSSHTMALAAKRGSIRRDVSLLALQYVLRVLYASLPIAAGSM